MADRAIFPSGRCWAGVPCAVHRGCTLSKRNTWNRTWQWGAKWEDKMFPELWGHIFDKVPLLVSFWSEDFTMTTILHIILETWNRKSTYNTSIAYIHIYIYVWCIYSCWSTFLWGFDCFYWISQNECRLFQQPAGTGQALDAPLLQWSDFEAGPMDGWLHSYRIHGTGYVSLPSLKHQQPVSHLKNLKMDGWNTK